MRGKLRICVAYLSIVMFGIISFLLIILLLDVNNGEYTSKWGQINSFFKQLDLQQDSTTKVIFSIAKPSHSNQNDNIGEAGKNHTDFNLADSKDLDNLDSIQSQDMLNSELKEPLDMISDIDSIDSASQINTDITNSSDIKTIDSNQYLTQQNYSKDYIVKVDYLNIRYEPNTKARILKKFKKGAIISISSVENGWGKLENGGYALLYFLEETK